MASLEVEYWDTKNETVVTESGFRFLDTKSVVKRVLVWEGTKEEIFKKFNSENNSLRYCNGSHYKFKDTEIQNEYSAWYTSLSESVKFTMYYGAGGIVD